MSRYGIKQKRALVIFAFIFSLLTLIVVAVGYMAYRDFEMQLSAPTILIVGAALLVASAILAVIWRQQQLHFDETHSQAAEDLLKQKYYLEKAQELGSIGTWELDLISNKLTWTEQTYKNFSIPLNYPLTFSAFLDCIHPEDLEYVTTEWAAALTGKPYDIEHRIITDKGVRWVREKALVEFIKDKPIRAIGFAQDITDRKRAEDALIASEDRLRMSLQAAHHGLYEVNVQTGETTVNREYIEMLGYNPDTYIETNATWHERQHPDDRAAASKAYQDYINGLALEYRAEFRQKKKDGSWMWTLSVGKIVEYDDAGKPLRLLGTHSDITEQKEAEEKLLLQSAALNAAANAIIITGHDGDVKWVNSAFTELTNYTLEEAVGKNARDLVKSGKQGQEFYKDMWDTLLGGKVWHGELINRRKDGSLYEEEQVITPLVNEEGVVSNFISVKQDITKRKLAEEALAASEAEMRALFKAMQDVVVVIDRDGVYRKIAPTNPKMLVKPSEELIGKTLREVFTPEQAERLANVIRQVLSAQKNERVEYWLNIDGQITWFEATISPMTEDSTLWVAHDITLRKKAQEQVNMQSAALNASANAVIITSLDSKFEWVNPAFTELTGYTLEEAVGKTPTLLRSGKHEKSFYQDLWKTVNRGEVWRGETINKRKDGSLYVEDQTITPVKDETGKIVRFVSIKQDVTERKQAEERIRQLSRAVESSPASIIITETNGNIQYVNPKFTQVTGYSMDEALGKKSNILKAEQTSPQTFKELWATISNGREWRGEFCNRKKNGDLYWELSSISPITDENGVITHYVSVSEDVTEQRAIREQLKKQNEYLSVLHEITLDVLDRRNLNDLLDVIVKRAAALLDAPFTEFDVVEGEELVVRAATPNLKNIIGKRFGREKMPLAWQAHDTGKPVVVENYMALSDNKTMKEYSELRANVELPIMAGDKCVAILSAGRRESGGTFSPEEIQTGELFSRLMGLVLDNANLYDSALKEISERKHAEALLLESEARFRQIVESVSDIIYRIDLSGNFTYINPPALHILGFTDESQIIGKNCLEIVAPESCESLKKFYDSQIEQRIPNAYSDFLAKTTKGEEIWFGQNVQLIMEDDEPIGLQAVARDVTQLKQAHEALSIAHDQALEASQLKSQLLARVSHELRTPLSGVLGYAELLSYDAFGELNAEQRDASQQIISSANYLTNLIEDLLDEAQINSKSLVLANMPFPPAEILTKVEATMSVLAQNKGLKFVTHAAPDLPEVLYGDLKRLQQIIINLAGNAIKFTRQGEVRVCLLRPSPNRWAIEISDTGAGIPEEAQEYVFEAFRQVNNAITRENRGSGLGLAITKQLVELMGGKITLKSEVGKGSAFTITLPFQKQTEHKND